MTLLYYKIDINTIKWYILRLLYGYVYRPTCELVIYACFSLQPSVKRDAIIYMDHVNDQVNAGG